MFADSMLDVTEALRVSAVHNLSTYEIEKILHWKLFDDDTTGLEFKIRWRGFEAAEDTWEPGSQILEDQRQMPAKCLRTTRGRHPALSALLASITASDRATRGAAAAAAGALPAAGAPRAAAAAHAANAATKQPPQRSRRRQKPSSHH
jgi:hypothetical protein